MIYFVFIIEKGIVIGCKYLNLFFFCQLTMCINIFFMVTLTQTLLDGSPHH